MIVHTLRKTERLHAKTPIEQLFADGKSLKAFPLRLVYRKTAEQTAASILVSVPKRRFKNAVDRNLIKRRIKEAYRHHKCELPLNIAFIYIAPTILDSNTIEKSMIKAIDQLNETN